VRYELVEVERFPANPEPGILYWSREFKMCAHRCACGCGDVIQLPVDELNYCVTEGPRGVTLRPSVGNWNICDAHYYITGGEVEWMAKWSPAQVAAGRAAEDARREAYYARRKTWRQRLWSWLGRMRAWFMR
jgi:hypothetical protein